MFVVAVRAVLFVFPIHVAEGGLRLDLTEQEWGAGLWSDLL